MADPPAPPPSPSDQPPKPPPRPRLFGRRFLFLLVGLLILNWVIASFIPSGHERVRIPYSPFLLDQVGAGNVKSISSKGSTVQGEFVKAVKSPPTDKNAKTETRFSTEIPTFA